MKQLIDKTKRMIETSRLLPERYKRLSNFKGIDLIAEDKREEVSEVESSSSDRSKQSFDLSNQIDWFDSPADASKI